MATHSKELKCHDEHPDCFARHGVMCSLLESYVMLNPKRPLGFERRYGTKFRGGCPFYKTAEEAGGSYDELCERYPLPFDPEDRKL